MLHSYEYHNPKAATGITETFTVSSVDLSAPNIKAVAGGFQWVIHESLAAQFSDQFSKFEIAKTADPHSPAAIDAQLERFRGPKANGQPAYLKAEVMVPGIRYTEWPGMVGVAKSKFAGRKSEYADISDVYVMPSWQNNGFGTGLVRNLLDGFSLDMPTAVYDFEFNSRTARLLKNLGFEAIKSWPEEYFGQTVSQTYYRGPLTGELVEILEKRSPWLKERVPTEP